MNKITLRKREGMVRLVLAKSKNTTHADHREEVEKGYIIEDYSEEEAQQATDFMTEMFGMCKGMVQECFAEMGYKSVPTGKGKERTVVKIDGTEPTEKEHRWFWRGAVRVS